MALRGAELLLVPIWGGNEVLGKARAIENHVFMATAGYGYPTYVIDPMGETLAIASEEGQVATATIDLNRRYTDDWLGLDARPIHARITDGRRGRATLKSKLGHSVGHFAFDRPEHVIDGQLKARL